MPNHPRLVLLHGFTQTGMSWRPVVDAMGDRVADFDVATPDLPGHGAQPSPARSLVEAADELAKTYGPATWVGYSLGGRHLLHILLQHPDAVERLVLLSATGGIDSEDDRAARRASDEDLAVSIEADGVDAFLHRWMAQPMFASLPPDPDGLRERRKNTATGLAESLRLAGTGTQEPLWDRLAQLGASGDAPPALVLAGAHDAKFRAAGERLATTLGPAATYDVVPDAGHAAHLERRAWVADRIAAWLTSP